jgi:hypothetical protein
MVSYADVNVHLIRSWLRMVSYDIANKIEVTSRKLGLSQAVASISDSSSLIYLLYRPPNLIHSKQSDLSNRQGYTNGSRSVSPRVEYLNRLINTLIIST